MSPQQACEEVIERIFYVNGGSANVSFNVKMIAFNKNGDAGVASIASEENTAPHAAIMTKAGMRLVEGKVMK